MQTPTLAATTTTPALKQVTFASIQSALDISANAVESWIVRAIGAKLFEGKIDQVLATMCQWCIVSKACCLMTERVIQAGERVGQIV